MKRTLLALLIVGLFSGVGSTVMAKDATAGAQPAGTADPAATQMPAKSTKQTNPAKSDDPAKAEYNAAKDKAHTRYKNAKAKCESMQGDTMRTCMSDAKTAQTDALAQAKTQWDSRSDVHGTDNDAMGKGKNGKEGGKPAKGDVNNSAGQ